MECQFVMYKLDMDVKILNFDIRKICLIYTLHYTQGSRKRLRYKVCEYVCFVCYVYVCVCIYICVYAFVCVCSGVCVVERDIDNEN